MRNCIMAKSKEVVRLVVGGMAVRILRGMRQMAWSQPE